MIIPTRSRPRELAECLGAISRLDYPRDRLEVVVVDDGSPEPVAEIVDSFRQHIELKLIEQSQAGPATARNTGVVHANSDYLAFTDDDCAPDPGWLLGFARQSAHDPGSAMGGRTINAISENIHSAASQMLVDYIYEYYNADENATFFASNNFAMARSAFTDLGVSELKAEGVADESDQSGCQ